MVGLWGNTVNLRSHLESFSRVKAISFELAYGVPVPGQHFPYGNGSPFLIHLVTQQSTQALLSGRVRLFHTWLSVDDKSPDPCSSEDLTSPLSRSLSGSGVSSSQGGFGSMTQDLGLSASSLRDYTESRLSEHLWDLSRNHQLSSLLNQLKWMEEDVSTIKTRRRKPRA